MSTTETGSPPLESSPSTPNENYQPHGSPAVAFLIGLSIILISSILNAGGLNVTKYDHMKTSALPKASRRKDYLRPLWVLGMLLYILSQLIGSTLALEYMRAEYVAPLGSTSLIFNFLFASLIGTPVSMMDIWGTVVVVLGVIGIVGFGSINSGLETEIDLTRLKAMWGRGGWLAYFFFMSCALIIVYIGTSQLDQVFVARSDLSALPTSSLNASRGRRAAGQPVGFFRASLDRWEGWMLIVREYLEHWTSAQDDKYIAWTLGIGWSCTGGGLAGACLIFAKATVKLISGSMSHRNEGNQFAHPASIFTVMFLAITAVSQIICLNRGLKVYDSTLVVPVFYGIYTAAGFLNSLIFNNEVDAYQTWTLFCLGVSILILISGVVLLTHKKPQPKTGSRAAGDLEGGELDDGVDNTHRLGPVPPRPRRRKSNNLKPEEEEVAVWEIGEDSDQDEDDGGNGRKKRRTSAPSSPAKTRSVGSEQARLSPKAKLKRSPSLLSTRSQTRSDADDSEAQVDKHSGEEGKGLMRHLDADDEDDEKDSRGNALDTPRPRPAPSRRTQSPSRRPSSDSDEFGSWEDSGSVILGSRG